MKKSVLSFLLALIPLFAIADAVEINGIYYDLDSENNIAVVAANPNSYSGAITIPESVTYEGTQYSVTNIGNIAFQNCTGLTSISIPNSVTRIGRAAFNGCSGITGTLTIPSSVTYIDQYAFQSTNITEVIINGSATLDKHSFSICPNLRTMKFMGSVSMRDWALQGANLKELYYYSEKKPSANVDDFGYPEEGNVIGNITVYMRAEFIEELKDAYPWKGFANILPLPGQTFKLVYKVDGEVYKTYDLEYGTTITPETSPTKEGYTFSGWSEIPATMPAKDVTVTGTFSINKYKLTYKVDGEVYKTYDIEYGANITPEPAPTKDGYTFSGWSNLPSTMPANDVTITGTFKQNETHESVNYEIQGNVVVVTNIGDANGAVKIDATVVINGKTYEVTAIVEEAFKGCQEITSVDIPSTVSTIGAGAFEDCSNLTQINIGKGIKEIGSKAFANIFTNTSRTRSESSLDVYCESEFIPSASSDAFEGTPLSKATLHVPDQLVDVYKLVLPWNGFGSIVGLNTTGIEKVLDSQDVRIYDIKGNRLDNLRKGINVIKMSDGRTKKVMVK